MGPAAWIWLVVACILVVAAQSQDHVLRFLSQEDIARMAKETDKQTDDIIVSNGDYKGQPLEKFRAKSTVCPNEVTECPETSTCCPLQNGQFGCCDGVNAVCCKDGVHCCPEGFKCDEERSQCASATLGLSFHWVDKKVMRSRPVVSETANVTCGDKKTTCKSNDTCCNATVGFGCCPLSHAVCCRDKAHCCPANTKCDLVHRRCFREDQDGEEPWVEKRLGEPKTGTDIGDASARGVKKTDDVTCKDGQICPDGDTCCLMTNGSYGCCPFSDAVCCSDHIHCCPHGCTCDYKRHGCVGWVFHKWSQIVRPKGKVMQASSGDVSSMAKSVVCPGGSSECPDGSTCCQLASGDWGCCPKVNAVCCSDHIHCCPESYTCDVSAGSCNPPGGQTSLPWETKKPARPRVSEKRVICPGGTSQCSDGQTCCKLPSGVYGCCPFPQAVCCKDGTHCCPHGTTCDLAAKTCDRGTASIPWLSKQPASPRSPSNVICPDGHSQCSQDQTCCKNAAGAYACCPSPNATCCSDNVHCCPHGYKCDLATQSCVKGPQTVSPVTEVLSSVRIDKVICPDRKSECSDGQTCCLLSSGEYGCCPKPNAVCCPDRLHCCPQGYTCDTSQGRCNKGAFSLPWDLKEPARLRVDKVVCPDQSACPDGQTCCQLHSGQYGCCPQPDAVCCSDHIHCCPHGYTCDTSQGRCKKGAFSLPWDLKRPARRGLH